MNKKISLLIGMFALGLDAYIIAGLIPAMSNTFFVSTAQMGQAVTIFTLCYAFSAPIFSTYFANKSLKKVLLIAMGLFILGNAASAFSSSYTTLLITRAICGVGAGLFSPMAATAAVALMPENKKGKALSLILGGMSSGTVVGVPLGLLIAQFLNWKSTFLFIAFLGCLAFIGIYRYFPVLEAKSPPSLKERLGLLVNGKIASTVGVTILTSVASLGLYTYLALILVSNNNQIMMPYLWLWGIGGIIGSFSIGSLIDRFGNPRIFMVGILSLMGLCFLSIPWLLSYSFFMGIPLLLWGCSGWASQAPQQHSLLSLKPNHSATVVALNSSANYLGSAIGAALGGTLIAFGVLPSYLPYAACLILCIALIGQIAIITTSKRLA